MTDKDESDLVMVSNESKEVVKDLIGRPNRHHNSRLYRWLMSG
jgi:hypothetical protein